MYNLCAPMGEVKKRRSRQEQERTHFVAKGPSDPANVSHQCAKRAFTASSGKLGIKLNDKLNVCLCYYTGLNEKNTTNMVRRQNGILKSTYP